MMVATGNRSVYLTGFAMVVLVTVLVGVAVAQAKPIKEILSARYGWEVNKNGTNVCVKAEELEGKCQAGRETSKIGGFAYPTGTAVNNDSSSAQYGDVYIVDITHRVQVYTPSGQFVFAFGTDVNKTTGESVCTRTEMTGGDECQPGATGLGPGHFNDVYSIAVDPVTGDVYVAESVNLGSGYGHFGERVQELSSEGAFIAEFGQEVNQTTKGNICSAIEEAKGVVCGAPSEHPIDGATTEHDGFAFSEGTIIAIGGPEDLLYVGEKGRVQELQANGGFVRVVPLQSINTSGVRHIAVDANGDVYLTFSNPPAGIESATGPLYAFDSSGKLTGKFLPPTRQEGNTVGFVDLQVDPLGRLAVTEAESLRTRPVELRGTLYNVGGLGLQPISEFAEPGVKLYLSGGASSPGLYGASFAGDGDLYGVNVSEHELVAYEPVAIGELTTGERRACAQSTGMESDVALSCLLEGEVNPYGVANTSVWYQWGYTSRLGQQTSRQAICAAGCGEAGVQVSSGAIDGLVPNATFDFRLVGEDQVVKTPELLTGALASVKLPSVAPRIVGEPTVSFVNPESALFEGQVNPENSSTEYFVEYGTGEALADCSRGAREKACAGVHETGALQSSEYRTLGGTFEASGLAPSTTYRFRLNAVNDKGEAAVSQSGGTSLPEGEFTTAPPVMPQASTGAAGAITATGATIAGSIDPGGEPASYAFELGVYNPAGTRFGTVQSGSAGAGVGMVSEELQLSGLQPGTTYAYRIAIHGAYVPGEAHTLFGATGTFTTQGLPAVLPEALTLAMLPMPSVKFPKTTQVTVHALTRAQKLKNALRACKRKRNKKSRVSCERSAHKLYGPKRGKGRKRK